MPIIYGQNNSILKTIRFENIIRTSRCQIREYSRFSRTCSNPVDKSSPCQLLSKLSSILPQRLYINVFHHQNSSTCWVIQDLTAKQIYANVGSNLRSDLCTCIASEYLTYIWALPLRQFITVKLMTRFVGNFELYLIQLLVANKVIFILTTNLAAVVCVCVCLCVCAQNLTNFCPNALISNPYVPKILFA